MIVESDQSFYYISGDRAESQESRQWVKMANKNKRIPPKNVKLA